MTKQQRLVVLALVAFDLLVFMLLGYAFVTGSAGRRPKEVAKLPTPTVTPTPLPTGIPTWTPVPMPTPFAQPTPTLRPLRADDAAVLDQVEREVSSLRGLSPLESVPRWKITRSQLRKRYADVFITDDWADAARAYTLAFAALDLMPAETDLLNLWRDGFSDGVAGFYMIAEDEIFVVSDAYSLGATERAIYAHEFGHALQDQYFDLETLGLDVTGEPEHSDHILAVQSLIEGDAELIQEQYIDLYFTETDALDLLNESLTPVPLVSESAPRVLGQISLFPYTFGKTFVGTLHEQGGWQAVDEAYVDPPSSTEQIMHPERYLAGDQPVLVPGVVLTDTLGDGWRLVYDGAVGELVLRLYLENQLPASEAAVAAEGWGGDRCVVYHNDATQRTVLVLRVAWDTPGDAVEFERAYVRYADGRFDHPADQVTDELDCWQGTDALCVTRDGGRVTVVLGPDSATVDRVFAQLEAGL